LLKMSAMPVGKSDRSRFEETGPFHGAAVHEVQHDGGHRTTAASREPDEPVI